MISIHAHFDGKVIVPHGKVDLSPGQAMVLRIEPVAPESADEGSALEWLAANAVDCDEIPSDLSHQHDRYLYGSPKRT